MQSQGLWAYSDETWHGKDLTDFAAEALDGGVGTVKDASDEIGSSYLIIDTGPWMFGKKVMLPAGIVEQVDHSAKKVFVNRTKDEIKNAPEYTESAFTDASRRSELARYYGPGGPAYREATMRAAVSKDAAQYTESAFTDASRRSELARYYGSGGPPTGSRTRVPR